jgi:hypothetical protein
MHRDPSHPSPYLVSEVCCESAGGETEFVCSCFLSLCTWNSLYIGVFSSHSVPRPFPLLQGHEWRYFWFYHQFWSSLPAVVPGRHLCRLLWLGHISPRHLSLTQAHYPRPHCSLLFLCASLCRGFCGDRAKP